MSKVIITIEGDGNIYFEVVNHSENYDVCTIVSTLCNVMIKAMERHKFPVLTQEEGHVRIIVNHADDALVELTKTIRDTFYEVEDQHPYFVKVY